jgi:hypothetical protein
MNSSQKIGFIPHVKDSVKIMDSDTFKHIFNKDNIEELNKSKLLNHLTKIEEFNAKFILSPEVNDLYKQIQSNCKVFKEKILGKVFNIESNIVSK